MGLFIFTHGNTHEYNGNNLSYLCFIYSPQSISLCFNLFFPFCIFSYIWVLFRNINLSMREIFLILVLCFGLLWLSLWTICNHLKNTQTYQPSTNTSEYKSHNMVIQYYFCILSQTFFLNVGKLLSETEGRPNIPSRIVL